MNPHIRCQKCSWVGTWEECMQKPGKFKGEMHSFCPKCKVCRTFLRASPPERFPLRYPADILSLPALSIRQPWAWLIVHGVKKYENRSWISSNPGRRFRGRFLVHAAQGCTKSEFAESVETAKIAYRQQSGSEIEIPPLYCMPRGCLVGVAEITGWHDSAPSNDVWAFGPGLTVENAKPFAPIDCKGSLGFFRPDFNLPSGLTFDPIEGVTS